jgi:2,5-furandicarboxylate decarboxylase 1
VGDALRRTRTSDPSETGPEADPAAQADTAGGAAVRDLRGFVAVLRSRGLLVDVHREVDPEGELGAVLQSCERLGQAAMFHRVRGSELPVVGGVLASWQHAAAALGCDVPDLFARFRDAPAGPVAPVEVEGPAPCQEVRDEPVDLGRLPVPVHAPKDAGRFINAAVIVARDPRSGRHNLSFARMQLFGPDRTGFFINHWADLDAFLRASEEDGRNLPFCAVVGVDPVLLMAAAFRSPGDEYGIAGALRGEPVPVVPATTSDIHVPSSAEIVLEGELVAGERRLEGPMAEFTGHYSGVREFPVATIHAITHRRDPIFQTIAGASREHQLLGTALTREPALDRLLGAVTPRVAGVRLPGPGFGAIVALDGPRPGEAVTVGIAALSIHVNTKCAIVVDADVDIHDDADVLWALSTRVRWDGDCTVIPGAMGSPIDPSSDPRSVQAKVIVDATLGPERGHYQKVRYPKLDLAGYVGGSADGPAPTDGRIP